MASTNIQTFPGKVGVSNTNPIHTLDIGSNVYIDDTAQTKLRIIGNIHASGVTVDGTITAIDSENLSVKDPIILLASGSTGTSDTGIIMKRADGDSNVAVFYDEGVGLKIGHTLSTAQDIHISVDSSNSLSTSIYGPVTVAHSSAQALVVQGGAEIADDFKVGTSKLFVDVSESNVGIGTNAPLATLDVHGTANVGALTATSISGPLSGNAATATALETARTIGGVSFDGTANIDLPGVNTVGTQNTSGNAATATALETARTIGGVSFDGTANIDLPGVNTVGTQNTSGNAATATALETARTIGGVSFDGTANIDLPGVNTVGTQNTSGNAATATALETARTIGGVSFDGTANIDLPGVNTSGNQDTTGNATTATTATNQSGGTVSATTGTFSGNVGIGTNSPIGQLQIGPKDNNHIYLASLNNAYGWKMDTDDQGNGEVPFRIIKRTGGNDTTVLTIKNQNGDVGIGTTNPLSALHIRGNNCRLNIADSSENDCDTNAFNCGIAFVDNTYDGTLTYAGNPAAGMGFYIGHLSSSNKEVNIKNLTGELSIATRNSDRAIYINNDGNVGIGTATPYAKLHVAGASGSFRTVSGGDSSSYFIYNSGLYTNTGGNFGVVSIYGQDDIIAGAWVGSLNGSISASDERIKKEIVDVEDGEALSTLRLLKPKRYKYRDEVKRGQEPVWGFIAQEVRDTLPYATQLRQDVLPNIYELANVSQSNVITFTNFNTSNLESNATTLIRTKGIDGEDHDIHLVEVVDEHTIRVEEDLSLWTGSVDAEGNVITQIETTTLTPEEYEALEDKTGCVANISGYQNANVVISVEEYNGLEDTTGYEEVIENYTKTVTTHPGTQLFVYGQEVDDFIFVKKEAIWTIATAALQEVDRQLQAEKAKTATLETQLASVLARLDALENP